MTIKDLQPREFDPYYGQYIHKLRDDHTLIESFEAGKETMSSFFKDIPPEKHEYCYAENKWSCKEILQHLIDTERMFMYRCFRIARNDKTELAGFDQNIYVEPSRANQKTMNDLLAEFQIVRDGSISLLNSLTPNDLKNIGTANGGHMSARAAAFTITGHEIWHKDIIVDRYL